MSHLRSKFRDTPTLTKALHIGGSFVARATASRERFECIEISYNQQLRHSTLGFRTRVE